MRSSNNALHVTAFRIAVIFALVVGLGLANIAQAATHEATLDGSQEVPPVVTPASGSAKLDLDAQAKTLRIVLVFENLIGSQIAAHIHGPAPPGQNAGILLGLPLGQFDQTFNIDQATLDTIQNGLAYINIHSTMFPGGEIRGQITAQPLAVERTTFSRVKAMYR